MAQFYLAFLSLIFDIFINVQKQHIHAILRWFTEKKKRLNIPETTKLFRKSPKFKNGDIHGQNLECDQLESLAVSPFPLLPIFLGDKNVFMKINHAVVKILQVFWIYGYVLCR